MNNKRKGMPTWNKTQEKADANMEIIRQEMMQLFWSNAEPIQTETSNTSARGAPKRQRPNTPGKAPRTKVSLSPKGGDAMNSSLEESSSESSNESHNNHPGGPNYATQKHSRKHEKQKA